MTRSRTRRSRRGMSLLEVMVAIAIVLIMSVATYAVIDSSIRTRNLLAERDETARSSRVAMAKIRRELQLAFMTKYPQAALNYQTVFVGKDDNPDKLTFATLAHQRLYRDSRECDQAEITLWTESGRDGSKGETLYHRESARVDEKPDEDGVIYPLAYNVRTFNLRYLDARTNEWVDDWDTRSVDQAGRLPRAVQIGLVLIGEQTDYDGDTHEIDVPLITTVELQYGEELQTGVLSGSTLPPDTSQINGGNGSNGFNGGGFNPGANMGGTSPIGIPAAGGMPGRPPSRPR